MTAHKNHLGREALFLALWALIAAGFLASPNFGDPQHKFSMAVAATENSSGTVASQTELYVKQHASRDGASASDREFQAARRAHRRTRILIVAALVYVPPFLILVLGWVIARIARGFRSA